MAKKKLDSLQMLREMSKANDKFQTMLRECRKDALALAETLFPEKVTAGEQFEYDGFWYVVKHYLKWDFTHVTIDPIFNEWRRIKHDQKQLDKKLDEVMQEIFERFPHLKPREDRKVLTCLGVKEKKANKKK